MKLRAVLCALLVAAMFLGTFSCAIAEAKPVITVWIESQNTNFKSFLEAYKNDKFDVEFVYFNSEDLKNQIRIALSSSEAPDITMANTGTFFDSIMQADMALPLDDYAAKYGWLDRVEPAYLDSMSYNGKLYGVPLVPQAIWGVMFYNADFFEKNGLEMPMYPSTEELIALSAKVKELGKQPIAYGNVDMWPGILLFGDYLVQASDPSIIGKLNSGEVKWNESPEVRSCFEELAKIGQNGCWSTGFEAQDHNAAIESFVNQTCAMLYMGSWWVQYIEGGYDALKFHFKTVASPRFAGVELAKAAQVWASTSTFIYAGTKNPDYAAEFLDYLSSADAAKAQYLDTLQYTFNPAFNNKGIEINPQLGDSDAFTKQFTLPRVNYMDWNFPTAVIETMKVEIQKLFTGDTTVDDALNAIEAVAAEER